MAVTSLRMLAMTAPRRALAGATRAPAGNDFPRKSRLWSSRKCDTGLAARRLAAGDHRCTEQAFAKTI
jgi:hypothetical protein